MKDILYFRLSAIPSLSFTFLSLNFEDKDLKGKSKLIVGHWFGGESYEWHVNIYTVNKPLDGKHLYPRCETFSPE